MVLRPLGRTGLQTSIVGFGAGPVAAIMTDPGAVTAQLNTVQAALEAGINWFDTAPGYGDGASEQHLGRALQQLGALDAVSVATKVRLQPDELSDVKGAVRRSVEGSLRRLGRDRVQLLQLHNAITTQAGEIHLSLTPPQAIAAGEVMAELCSEGLCVDVGMTAQGDAEALREVLASGVFATAQLPWNLLESVRLQHAGGEGTASGGGLTPADCVAAGVAVIAIRVLAGGALALRPPSEHTRRTRFFPLAQYEADLQLAQELQRRCPEGLSLAEAALQHVLHHDQIALSLVGFAVPGHVAPAVAAADPIRPPCPLTDFTRRPSP